jgi:hypothetical protein
MAEEFSKRTAVNGRMTFGLGRTKKLICLMHWIQDCFRTDDDPDHTAFDEQALAEAQSCAHVRKSDIDLVDTNAKTANPGKFKRRAQVGLARMGTRVRQLSLCYPRRQWDPSIICHPRRGGTSRWGRVHQFYRAHDFSWCSSHWTILPCGFASGS